MTKLSYTNRDITSIRKEIVELIPKLTSDWTDFNESDIGMAYIEVLAGVTDMLGFYLDKQALENYLPTVTQPKNLKSILSVINLKPHMTHSASCYTTFYLPEPWYCDIFIPKYTSLVAKSNIGNVYYYTTEDCYILQGDLSVTVVAKQGQVNRVKLKPSELSKQQIKLLDDNVAEDSITVLDSDNEWSKVDNIFLSKSQGREYSVSEDKDDKAIISLSYNYEKLLSNSDYLEVIYATSLGAKGAVGANTITTILDKLVDSEGQNLDGKLLVTNNDRSSGGADRESLSDVVTRVPKVASTMGSAVVLSDYKALIEGYPSVLKSSTLDWSVPGNYVTAPYEVHSYIVLQDGNPMSDSLKNELSEYLRQRSVASTKVILLEPNYVDVNIDVSVEIVGTQSLASQIYKGLLEVVNNLFNPKNLEFGKGINISTLYTTIQSYHNSITDVVINSPTKNIKLDATQFLRLGDVNIRVESKSGGRF